MKKVVMMAMMGLLAGCGLFRSEEPRIEVDNAMVVLFVGVRD